jgi:hypothetical protein
MKGWQMKDSNKWRHHVERSLKQAGVKVKALPTGQTRIEGDHFAMTVSDLCRISYSQLQTLCGG